MPIARRNSRATRPASARATACGKIVLRGMREGTSQRLVSVFVIVSHCRDAAGRDRGNASAADEKGSTGLRALITGVRGFAGPHLTRALGQLTDWTLYGLSRVPVDAPVGYIPAV